MNALNVELVLLVSSSLMVLAAWLAAFRPDARELGIAGGILTFVGGLVLAFLRPHLPWLNADAVSLPRILVIGIGLVAVFSLLPRRHADGTATAAVVAMGLAHLVLAMVPAGLPVGITWVVCCALSWAALVSAPARRLALPYLTLAAGAGLVGSAMGGASGTALLLLAVAIRLGVFPFHSWAVAAYQLAPTSYAVAVVAPMSAIGLVARTPLGFEGTSGLAVMLFLAAAALVTAALAIVQRDLARAIGFLTVSSSTVVLLGVMDTDHIGHLGGLIMWNVTGLSLLGVGLVTAALRSRTGLVQLHGYSGLVRETPMFATAFLLFGLAAVGAPGTADFASEDLVLHGAMAHHTGLLLLFISAVSVQGYAVLHLFFHVFFGPSAGLTLADALPRERLALLVLAALLVTSGLAPQLLVNEWLGQKEVAAWSAEPVSQPLTQLGHHR